MVSETINIIKSEMANQPSFDKAKVESIKQAIANGSYSVDPEKLADSIIQLEKELGNLS